MASSGDTTALAADETTRCFSSTGLASQAAAVDGSDEKESPDFKATVVEGQFDLGLRPQSKELFEQLPQQCQHRVLEHFVRIMEIPRPSGKEEEIGAHLLDLAKRMKDVTGFKDQKGNIILRRKASPGYEGATKICMQAHQDMVTVKDCGVEHDFSKDPIKAFVEDRDGEPWLKGEGTTLGADDGIGVAAALAVLEDLTLQCGTVEALFTVEEETGLDGAIALKPGLLECEILLNLDSEEAHEVCIGCAGGMTRSFHFAAERAPVGDDEEIYDLHITGLAGGHSGVNIHDYRANAIKDVFFRIVSEADGVRIVAANSGQADNAIPFELTATVALKVATARQTVGRFRSYFDEIEEEYEHAEKEVAKCTSDWELKVSKQATTQADGTPRRPLTLASSNALVHVIGILPHGPLRCADMGKKMVDLSTNLAILRLPEDSDEATIMTSSRCPSEDRLKNFARVQDGFALIPNLRVSKLQSCYPGWDPNQKSPALAMCSKAHEKLFGRLPHSYSIHAGLEVGCLMNAYPNLDAVSMGPTITGAHTTDERLRLNTVMPFFEWARETISTIAEATKVKSSEQAVGPGGIDFFKGGTFAFCKDCDNDVCDCIR